MKNPRLLHSTRSVLAAVALTGLMAGAATRVHATSNDPTSNTVSKGQLADDSSTTDKHACKGQNSCKGKGGCKTGDAGCMAKNSCKGKGGCATDGSKKSS